MIHIIMCTYNGEKYIKDQLQSIADNTVTEWKLYTSDDKSMDNTKMILQEFANNNPGKVEVIVHEEKNGAPLHFLEMIQKVLEKMQGDDVIMLCDQDDVWFRDKIELTLEHMKKLRERYTDQIPLLVCSDVEVVDENMKQISPSFRNMNHYSIKNLDFPHLIMENKVQGCTCMINMSLASKIRELPKNISMHDSWLGLIACVMGKIDYIETPTMAYRQHASNVKGTMNYWQMIFLQLQNLSEQKYIVYREALQIKEFLRIYDMELDDYTKQVAKAFASLEQQGFWTRRKNIMKYHMWKTGIIRNIGLLVLI